MISTKPSGFLFCFDSYFLRNFHNDAAAPLRSEVVELATAEVAAQLQTTANKAGSPAEAENEEKTAQKDYERLMTESTESRASMSEGITSKEVAKADLDTKIEVAELQSRLQCWPHSFGMQTSNSQPSADITTLSCVRRPGLPLLQKANT